jgi:hypothetical protein
MDKFRKPSNSVCYTPQSEPYRIYLDRLEVKRNKLWTRERERERTKKCTDEEKIEKGIISCKLKIHKWGKLCKRERRYSQIKYRDWTAGIVKRTQQTKRTYLLRASSQLQDSPFWKPSLCSTNNTNALSPVPFPARDVAKLHKRGVNQVRASTHKCNTATFLRCKGTKHLQGRNHLWDLDVMEC